MPHFLVENHYEVVESFWVQEVPDKATAEALADEFALYQTLPVCGLTPQQAERVAVLARSVAQTQRRDDNSDFIECLVIETDAEGTELEDRGELF